MIRIRQTPKLPQIIKDESRLRQYLHAVANEAKDVFKREHSAKGKGRIYKRRGATHQASAAGDFATKQSGALLSATEANSSKTEAVLGTNTHYALYLTTGTKKMAARKMFREALNMALNETNQNLDGYVRYK